MKKISKLVNKTVNLKFTYKKKSYPHKITTNVYKENEGKTQKNYKQNI